MDRRSWLWRRKSSEKSPGETESSGSISSHSERFSDDQDTLRASPNHRTQSPEVTSKVSVSGEDVTDDVKSLKEKLSAALLNISAKEDLVKQHAKVAEEAVSGWEKAETEVVALKQQLETSAQKNSALEDRVSHLDGALKECVRQLRQGREEQEQKIHEAVVKKTREWESAKFELERQLVELQIQVEAAKAKAAINPDLRLRLEAAVKENAALKQELLAQVEDLEVRTLERDLSTQAAETASKQHLESIKKVAKLEAECRKLKATSRKASSINDHRSIAASSIYVESLTDSQSDGGERLLAVQADSSKMITLELNECEPSCSDSWASVLIAGLDQFKNDKAIGRNLVASSAEIDLMDDFLEMERLVALPETESRGYGLESGVVSDQLRGGDSTLKAELETMIQRTADLEEKLEMIETEKEGLNAALAESQSQLETSQGQLRVVEEKLAELQRQLGLANELKKAFEIEVKAATAKREEVETQLVSVDAEVHTLYAKVDSLEAELEKEHALLSELTAKCGKLENELSRKRKEAELCQTPSSNGELKIKQEEELVVAAGKLAECQKTIASLGRQLKSLATLEDFLIDYEKPLELSVGGSPIPRGGEPWKLHSNDAYLARSEADSSKVVGDGSGCVNGKVGESPPSSGSSSSASSVNNAIAPEKSRNGFGKLFSRSKSSTRVENQ
ncbi:filament-like plant protein [Telopea speciosissima]|uniref:filament-like plant protein n=1 Tax=Telopea speciosissima TaxID=54955 RepID=UPI001CC6BEE2|nr:filament-like plant protein [Telopea speciosissima]XP_043720046.1 filament-like plant protein [Telopea speciosissima]XP_043720047.1 filament-like plant protein [Telopea speciosissima]